MLAHLKGPVGSEGRGPAGGQRSRKGQKKESRSCDSPPRTSADTHLLCNDFLFLDGSTLFVTCFVNRCLTAQIGPSWGLRGRGGEAGGALGLTSLCLHNRPRAQSCKKVSLWESYGVIRQASPPFLGLFPGYSLHNSCLLNFIKFAVNATKKV